MNRFLRPAILVILILSFWAGPGTPAARAEEPLWVNWGYIFEELLANRYYSHGCFHLTPLATKIFYEAVPRGTRVIVKSYNDSPPSWVTQGVPDLLLCVNSRETLRQAREAFAVKGSLQIEAYPRTGMFILYYNQTPYARLRFRPGYENRGYMYFGTQNGRAIFDDYQVTPTYPGIFFTYYYTDYLYASRYPLTTTIPYGEEICKKNQGYFFNKNNRDWPVPPEIINDLALPKEKRIFCYFEENYDFRGQLISARWGSHDYGTLVIGLSPDNKNIDQDLIYATGLVINDQRDILDSLSRLLANGTDIFEESIALTGTFKEEQTFFDFLYNSPTVINNPGLTGEIRRYLLAYEVFNRRPVFLREKILIDPVYQAALNFLTYGERKLSNSDRLALAAAGAVDLSTDRPQYSREKIQGIYYSLSELAAYVTDGAKRYQKLKEFWPIFLQFKSSLAASSPASLSVEQIRGIIQKHLNLEK